MGVFDNLKIRPLTRLTSTLWNTLVDTLSELYGWLTDGTEDINVDEVYGRGGYFSEQVYVQGKPVIKDGDPISIYQFFEVAKSQITDAIDKSSLLSKTASDLDQIYGKLPSKNDVTDAIDSARVTGYSLDIREYTRRTADSVGTYAPKLATIEQYTKDTRDVVVKLKMDVYGNVGVRIAEPLDEYGRVVVSTPSELLDEFKPVSVYGSITATGNVSGFSIVLDKGGRPNVNIYYMLGGAGEVYLKVSRDGVNWRTIKTYSLTAAGDGIDIVQGISYPFVRLETPTTGIDVEFEIIASR